MHTVIILNPGHFHAALVLRDSHPSLADDIFVYSEQGPDLDRFIIFCFWFQPYLTDFRMF